MEGVWGRIERELFWGGGKGNGLLVDWWGEGEGEKWEEVQKLLAVIAAGTLFDSLEKAK